MAMKQQTTTKYKTLGAIFVDLAEMFRPPEDMNVSECAAEYRELDIPGSYVGKWINDTVAPMVEPMNVCIMREYEGLIFVGPAQSAKTDSLVLNFLAYSIKIDPMDMMLVCPTMIDGRDFSMRRVDRMHMHSPKIGEMLRTGASSDNVFDKHYRHGMMFTIGWPTPSQLAGKPIGRVILTDRDRMDDDIGPGDGEPYDLAAKRTTTFGSYAMTVAESSPSKPITDLKWLQKTPHQAPPCEGILKLYNRGDRRRWYWPCPDCNQYFEGNFKDLVWDTEMAGTNHERAQTVKMVCPHCAYKISFGERAEMMSWGVWLKDGQGIDSLGRVFGPSSNTRIASFWLKGVAAAFVKWPKLVSIYLDAMEEYDRTGSEEGLKKFYNNDCGEPYYPMSMNDDERSPIVLQGRAEVSLPERKVPVGVNFMVATIDVQKRFWIVHVFGIIGTPGAARFDSVVIDRFKIVKSERTDDDGDPLPVAPHQYLEDWNLITSKVIEKTYEVDDGSGRHMGIFYTTCDSGGQAGVTSMAYNYYRHLRSEGKGRNFILTKGDHALNMPRTRLGYPDSNRTKRMAGISGDVPVLFLNANQLKDDLNGRLGCLVPGQGMYRTPGWLDASFYGELCAETRTPKGWECPDGVRNEATDCSYYMIGVCVSQLIGIEKLDWEKPPRWAQSNWDLNILVFTPTPDTTFAPDLQSRYDFAAAGRALA